MVKNAKALAKTLNDRGIELVTGGTDNHMILMKCGTGRGAIVDMALDIVGLTTNKNTIPDEPSSPFYPSGIRLGTPSVTTRRMKEKEMAIIGNAIVDVMEAVKNVELPDDKSARKAFLATCRKNFAKNKELAAIRAKILKLCRRFPIPNSFV